KPGFAWPYSGLFPAVQRPTALQWRSWRSGFTCKGRGGPICSILKHGARGRSGGGEESLRMALPTHPAARLCLARPLRRAGWMGLILGACLLLLAPGTARLCAQPTGQPAPADRPVLLVDIKGAIGVVSADQLAKALQRAAAAGAQALVVRMDTPGGLL